MGVRLALGDTPLGVIRRVLREPALAIATGLTGGAGLASLVASAAAAYVYQIEPYDPRLWTATVVVMLGAAALGAIFPALRAARLDPVAVLKED
jgi:ABC-type antimicrobial peptide transport system permease subunit